MQRWELQRDHEHEVREALQQAGCLDSMGCIRRWNPEAWRQINARQHSSLSFSDCCCRLTAKCGTLCECKECHFLALNGDREEA